MAEKTEEIKLDSKDRKILKELDFNARETLGILAKKVGVSKQVLDYRIKQLEKKGVIAGYYPVIDYSTFGCFYARIFLKYLKVRPDDEKKIIDYAKTIPKVGWIVKIDDDHDLVIGIYVKNIKEIYDIEKNIELYYGKFFSDIRIELIVAIHNLSNDWIFPDSKTVLRKRFTVGNGKVVDIDEIDKKILEILGKDGKAQLIDIAKSVKMTPKAVAYRIKNLEKNKVILCYRAAIDFSKLGFIHYKVFINYSSNEPEKIKQILQTLEQDKRVIYFSDSVGKKIEFEVLVKSYEEIYELMANLRQSFGDIITSYDFIITHKIYFERYVPENI